MDWLVTETTDEETWTREYVAQALAMPTIPLPDHKFRFGNVEARWFSAEPEVAVILTEGGTCDDRALVEAMLRSDLACHGYRQARFTFDHMRREAHWNDIMAKAKRLIQSNQVQLLRNGYNVIVAHVIGDHGEYNCEISRDDPQSRTITQWQCFMPDAPITMADGSRKRIDEIIPGDSVLTHRGRARRVLNQWSRPYIGRMARVKLQGIDEPVSATADHRFWAANDDYYLQDSVGWRGRIKLGKGPLNPLIGWREAQDLQPGHYLSMAQMGEDRPCVINDVVIDEGLATFLGWYTAEGYVVSSTKNRIGLNLHRDERHVAEKLSDITAHHFGAPGGVRTMRWPSDPERMEMVEFRVSHPSLRALVEEAVGVGSANKSIHPAILSAPEPIQRAFLAAYLEGDGNVDGNRARIGTVSEALAHSLRLMLTRLGHPSTLSWIDDNSGNGFVRNSRRFYSVRWSLTTRRNAARFIRDGHAWFKVEAVEFFDYEGPVFDMEVADDHSFQVFGVNAHNCECPWDQYAFQRTRKWKKYEGRPCAHVLAAYWKSLSTPFDEDNAPSGSGGMPAPTPYPNETPPASGGGMGQTFLPDEGGGASESMPTPEVAPNAGGDAGVIPSMPGPLPPAQPGTTPPGGASPPNAVSVPGAQMPTPGNPTQYPGGTFSHVRLAADFENGQMVRLNQDDWGIAEGPSDQHGSGQQALVPAGSIGEVLGQDPTTGWVDCIFAGPCRNNGALQPTHIRLITPAKDLTPAGWVQAPGPAVKRRT